MAFVSGYLRVILRLLLASTTAERTAADVAFAPAAASVCVMCLLCLCDTSHHTIPALALVGQAADKKSDTAQRDRLKNQFNLGVADCPVFPNIFDYCQVGDEGGE